ncbi:hypothetical protein FOZ63_005228, partial [Perkinsus olseni]
MTKGYCTQDEFATLSGTRYVEKQHFVSSNLQVCYLFLIPTIQPTPDSQPGEGPEKASIVDRLHKKIRFSLSSNEIFSIQENLSTAAEVEEVAVAEGTAEGWRMRKRSFMLVCVNALISTNLASPYAFSRVGWFSLIIASLITGLVGGAVWLQAHLLQSEAVTSYARLRGVGVLNREYGFLAEMLFGPKGRSVITTMIGIQFLLTLIANMVALAEAGSLLFRIDNGYCVLVFAVLSFALSV